MYTDDDLLGDVDPLHDLIHTAGEHHLPGINDTGAHFAQAAAIAKSHPNIRKVEIMPYHAIGADKWAELGLRYSLPDLPTVPPEQAAQWQRILDDLLR